MAVIHSLASFSRGGVDGIQATQRDWSPYVVHFTSYREMGLVQRWAKKRSTPRGIARSLQAADKRSFHVVKKIARAGKLLAFRPSGKAPILACVCLSECNLPGLIGHSERYGRFGFVFRKAEVFRSGGRPCIYVDRGHYRWLKESAAAADPSLADATSRERRLYSLANTYAPMRAGDGGGIQDYSHEREWRVFTGLDFGAVPPAMLLAPSAFVRSVGLLFGGVPVVPIDVLFQWGA